MHSSWTYHLHPIHLANIYSTWWLSFIAENSSWWLVWLQKCFWTAINCNCCVTSFILLMLYMKVWSYSLFKDAIKERTKIQATELWSKSRLTVVSREAMKGQSNRQKQNTQQTTECLLHGWTFLSFDVIITVNISRTASTFKPAL